MRRNSLYKPDVARSGPAALSLLVFPRPQGTKRAENFLPLFAAKGGLWPFCLSGSTAIAKIFSLPGVASGGPAGLASGGPAGQTRQHPTRVYVTTPCNVSGGAVGRPRMELDLAAKHFLQGRTQAPSRLWCSSSSFAGSRGPLTRSWAWGVIAARHEGRMPL